MRPEMSGPVGWGTGSTSYDAFLEREGVSVVRGLWVENVFEVPVGFWKRKGGEGANINLDGSGIHTSYIAIDCYLLQIPPGASLNVEHYVEHYMYEEILFVLKGVGRQKSGRRKRGNRPLNGTREAFLLSH